MTQSQSPETFTNRYGAGLCYSLALFLAHESNFKYVLAEVEMMTAEGAIRFEGTEAQNPKHVRDTLDRLSAIRWFSHAANALRNLIIPQTLPDDLKQRLQALREKAFACALPSGNSPPVSSQDIVWAIEEAKELLREIDECHDVETIKENAAASAERSPCLVFRD